MNVFPFFQPVISSLGPCIYSLLRISSQVLVLCIFFGGFHCYKKKVQTSHLELRSFLTVFSRWPNFLYLVCIAQKRFLHSFHTNQIKIYSVFFTFPVSDSYSEFHLLQGTVFLLNFIILSLSSKKVLKFNFMTSPIYLPLYTCLSIYPCTICLTNIY